MKSSSSNKKVDILIILFSIVAVAIISSLFRYQFLDAGKLPFDIHILPKAHAIINSLTAVCLLIALYLVKQRNVKGHKFFMLLASALSVLFLLSYLTYHSSAESTSYGGEGVLKYIYYFILITHIILAAIVLPFILMTLHRAFTDQIDKHKKLVRFTFPVWLYVAISGVLVYLMISPYY